MDIIFDKTVYRACTSALSQRRPPLSIPPIGTHFFRAHKRNKPICNDFSRVVKGKQKLIGWFCTEYIAHADAPAPPPTLSISSIDFDIVGSYHLTALESTGIIIRKKKKKLPQGNKRDTIDEQIANKWLDGGRSNRNGVVSVDWNQWNRSQRHLNTFRIERTASRVFQPQSLARSPSFWCSGRFRKTGNQNAGEYLDYSVDLFVFDYLYVGFGEFCFSSECAIVVFTFQHSVNFGNADNFFRLAISSHSIQCDSFLASTRFLDGIFRELTCTGGDHTQN